MPSQETVFSNPAALAGRLIVNADDWGADRETTQKTLDCVLCGGVSSVSAMVFMEDSERAAAQAQERRIDTGIHLNFTAAFSAANCPPQLKERQRQVGAYLHRTPFYRGIYNPLLANAFEYVVAAQREEFLRLYGTEPERYDGHHHMHLSANVLLGKLIPAGTMVRQHFSYESREKSLRNRVFRSLTRAMLGGRYRKVDFLFSLPPLDPRRLEDIFAKAREFSVEVETHPINPGEYKFLTEGGILRAAGNSPVASSYLVRDTQTLRQEAAHQS